MEGYFTSLEKLAKGGKLPSSRIRFLVRDLLDLRRNKWVPRREKIQVRLPAPRPETLILNPEARGSCAEKRSRCGFPPLDARKPDFETVNLWVPRRHKI